MIRICNWTHLMAAGLLACVALRAGSIEGVIVVKRKLTKRSVTSTATPYQRGTAVALGTATPDADPLSFERSRVVIYLEGREPAARKPTTAASIEQKDRRFTPDLLIIPAGAAVSFPNLDPIFHNVFSLSKPKAFDLGFYAKDRSKSVTFPEPGIVFVNCHLHPNMTASIVVTPNEWSARAGRDGHFTIGDVPPGRYEVVAWHKAAGFFRQTVDVGAETPANITFLIPFDELPRETNAANKR